MMSEWIEKFKDYLQQQGYRHMTLVGYIDDIKQFYDFLRRKLGREPKLSDLSPEACREYLAEQAKTYRRSTLMRRLASLRSFQRYLMSNGQLEQPFVPPTRELNQYFEQAQETQAVVCFNSQELLTLWERLLQIETPRAKRDLAIISLFVEWGFPSEWLIRFTLDDLDLDQARIRVTDIAKNEIWFPIKAAVEPLRRYLQIRPRFNAMPDTRGLFLSQLGRSISRQSLWQSLRSWGNVLHLAKPLTPQALRNTAAYRLSRANVPPIVLQLAFGHTNPLSTRFLMRRLHRACENEDVSLVPILHPDNTITMEPGAEERLDEEFLSRLSAMPFPLDGNYGPRNREQEEA
ncbi:MAG: tyrosine-type recombinase/integrase [Chloroflexi bacterium]|nr:tyrosine-type recombinase/integrase [Chloroflexota bacterium]